MNAAGKFILLSALVLFFVQPCVSQNVIFHDSLDGSSQGTVSGVNFETGYLGKCANLTDDSSYILYSGSILPSGSGTVEFYWKPPDNIYEIYSYRHSTWTDYGQYLPPSGGYLLDNIGWNAAPTGSFSLTLSPISWQNPESETSWIGFSIWDGSKWNWARNVHSNRPTLSATVEDGLIKLTWNSSRPIRIWDPNAWYLITVTWGSSGMHLYVNGVEWANNSHTGTLYRSKSFALGQYPDYWPYGPHTMLGCYDEFKIYDSQIVPSPSDSDPSAPAGFVIYYGTSPGSYTNQIEVGNTDRYELNLPPGRYYIAVAAKTESGFTGPRSNEVAVSVQQQAQVFSVEDDFSSDTGLWEYYGSAYRDTSSGYVVLTENLNNQVGVIWLKQNITTPFTAEFRYYSGGGSGADGLVFMFYRSRDYTPGGGGYLGFTSDASSEVPGYGIEFDSHYQYNSWDPQTKHVALISNSVSNHIRYIPSDRIGDGRWHDVRVVVGTSEVEVYIDGELTLNWTGELDRSYGGIGFSAGTGVLNNWHIIDDVRISVLSGESETIPDSIDDAREQIVSKYNPSFDWKTQTPSKDDVTQAVINAVMQYFTTSDDATRQEIVGDVVQLVILYFTLPD